MSHGEMSLDSWPAFPSSNPENHPTRIMSVRYLLGRNVRCGGGGIIGKLAGRTEGQMGGYVNRVGR
jgi:hypothetical protein